LLSQKPCLPGRMLLDVSYEYFERLPIMHIRVNSCLITMQALIIFMLKIYLFERICTKHEFRYES